MEKPVIEKLDNFRLFMQADFVKGGEAQVSLKSRALDTISAGSDERPVESHRSTRISTKFVVRGYLFPSLCVPRLDHVPPDKLTYLSASRCIELIRQLNTSRSKLSEFVSVTYSRDIGLPVLSNSRMDRRRSFDKSHEPVRTITRN